MTWRLLLHLAGPGTEPFPDVATALQVASNAHERMSDTIVEVIVQGPSVSQLAADGKHAPDIAALHGIPGICITACANSLHAAGLAPDALVEGVAVVPAAIAHLAQRQHDGAAYVRL
ncbi:DsrE family protein [Glutamicibacter arilaitensis]|uniref:DsrE family protein n=1 Tax=Glutamicibacter arilaitensis TaxID=256701 RepID=UPI003F920D19